MSGREEEIGALCRELAERFQNGRYDGLTRFYTYPLPIYVPGGLRTEITERDTVAAISQRRAAALANGMARVEVIFHEIGDTRLDRFPIRLDWSFRAADGREIGRSEMRYFVETAADGSFRVVMIEFLRLAFPVVRFSNDGSILRH